MPLNADEVSVSTVSDRLVLREFSACRRDPIVAIELDCRDLSDMPGHVKKGTTGGVAVQDVVVVLLPATTYYAHKMTEFREGQRCDRRTEVSAMSDYHVLYYPRYEPSATWLRSILLFVDSVHRIIPKEARHVDSRAISELRENFSDADPVPAESPEFEDLWIGQSDQERMMKAFLFISEKKSGKGRESEEILFDYHFIHRAKIPPDVLTMLKDTKLIDVHPYEQYEQLAKNGYLRVQRDAGHLILSYIAGRIARREGWDAVTNFKLGFAVNALEGVQIAQEEGRAEGSLLAALVSCHVPGEIRHLSMDDFVELRKRYEGIRGVFQSLTRRIAAQSRLDRIDNLDALNRRVEKTADEFSKEFVKFRRSRLGKLVKKWTPLAVGGLVGILTGVPAVTSPHLVAGPAAGKATQVGLQIFDKKVNRVPQDPEKERAFQMISDLQADIIKRSPLKSMLHL